MARVSVKKPLSGKQEQKLLERLFLAFSSFGNWQEAESFLVEFYTTEELAMLAKRLELYKQTCQKRSYKQIMHRLRVTSQTVRNARKKISRADVYFLRVIRKFLILDQRFL